MDWEVEVWEAPSVLPPIVDDPLELLPATLPQVDLVLALGETPGLAQLIPEIVRLAGARAVIAPVDNARALPPGLAGQLNGWLEELGVPVVFPKPFCSLTKDAFGHKPVVKPYQDPLIARFAAHFGRPEFKVEISEGRISKVEVRRDAACGCARHAAGSLVGTPVDEALEKAGLLHHHYPCLATMSKDIDYNDTLMHVSGNLLKEALRSQINDHLSDTQIRPQGFVEDY